MGRSFASPRTVKASEPCPITAAAGSSPSASTSPRAITLPGETSGIELIKQAPSPADARRGLVERRWQSGTVETMLARAGAEATRPEDLPEGFGLTPERVSDLVQAASTPAR